MIQELKQIFQSLTKSLEILYLIEDVKPCARIMVHEDKLEQIKQFLQTKGLYFTLSDFKVIKEENARYSNKGKRVPVESEEKGYYFMYISKEQSKTEQAKQLEAQKKHKELGILLGYPECCSEFFQKHSQNQEKTTNDYILPAYNNSQGYKFPFHNNIIARYFDYTLLNHFPCNFNCNKSIELAKKHLEIIQKHNPQLVNEIQKILKSVALFTEYSGKYLFLNPEFTKNVILFKNILATAKGRVFYDLEEQKEFEIIGEHHIKIGFDKNPTCEDLCVFVFE